MAHSSMNLPRPLLEVYTRWFVFSKLALVAVGHGSGIPRTTSKFRRNDVSPDASHAYGTVRLKRARKGATALSLPKKRINEGTAYGVRGSKPLNNIDACGAMATRRCVVCRGGRFGVGGGDEDESCDGAEVRDTSIATRSGSKIHVWSSRSSSWSQSAWYDCRRLSHCSTIDMSVNVALPSSPLLS